jgi:hypothetical protein
MIKPNHPEIGRELLAGELRRGMIVWLQKEGRSAIATMWVTGISAETVEFYAGVTNIHFLARRLPDGHIYDDTGNPMAIYLYLGKP